MVEHDVRWIVTDSGGVYVHPEDLDALWRKAIAEADRTVPANDVACRWIEEKLSELAVFFASVAVDAIEFGRGEHVAISHLESDG